jgi:hypothetical protein
MVPDHYPFHHSFSIHIGGTKIRNVPKPGTDPSPELTPLPPPPTPHLEQITKSVMASSACKHLALQKTSFTAKKGTQFRILP